MNRVALIICGLALVLSSAQFLRRAEANLADATPAIAPGTITAYGSGTVTSTPDSARLYFTVITRQKSAAGARAENARVAGQAQAALLNLKLPDLKAKTRDSRLSIDRDETDKARIVGYTALQTFSVVVKVADPETLGSTAARVLDVALENGVNSGGDVEFFKADETDLQRQAMTKAVEDGIANARAYAKGANLTPTGIVEITPVPWGNAFGGMQGGGIQGGFGGGIAGGAPSFAAGDWKVTQQVRVVMKY